MENRSDNPMLTGVIWKQILLFFFPILIGAFFQQLYNTVDAVVAGRFAGKEALASVGGSSSRILGFIFSFFMGLSTGATVIIAQAFGASHPERVDDALHTSYTFGAAGGILLGGLGFLFTRPLLSLLRTPEDLMPGSVAYVRILTPFYAVFAIAEITGSALRAEGHVMVNTVSNLLGICVFRINWVTFIYPAGTFRQIMVCYPISWVLITIFISGYYLLKQKKILAKIHPENG